jgi:hypothetical protein
MEEGVLKFRTDFEFPRWILLEVAGKFYANEL